MDITDFKTRFSRLNKAEKEEQKIDIAYLTYLCIISYQIIIQVYHIISQWLYIHSKVRYLFNVYVYREEKNPLLDNIPFLMQIENTTRGTLEC